LCFWYNVLTQYQDAYRLFFKTRQIVFLAKQQGWYLSLSRARVWQVLFIFKKEFLSEITAPKTCSSLPFRSGI